MKRDLSPTASSSAKRHASTDTAANLDAAVRAVGFASGIAMEVQADLRAGKAGSIEKTDHSPVTIADYAVQCMVIQYLSIATGAGAQLRIVAEEDSELLKEGSRDSELVEVARLLNDHFPFQEVARVFPDASCPSSFTREDILRLLQCGNYSGGADVSFWVLDPIDGTRGFVRDAQYAIGLALVENSSPVLSAMACPNLPAPGGDVGCRAVDAGFVYFASGSTASAVSLSDCRKQIVGGAPSGFDWHKFGSPLHAAPACALNAAVLCESYESKHRDGDALLPRLEKKKVLSLEGVHRLDSMCKYGLVARGDAHIYLRGNCTTARAEQIWDHAPGVPIVVNAGGKVSDLFGKPLNFGVGRTLSSNKGILAAPAGVHEGIISEIALLNGAAIDQPQ